SGNRKTYLPSPFPIPPSPQFYKLKYIPLPHLFHQFPIPTRQPTYTNLIKKYNNLNLLIFHHSLLTPLKQTQSTHLLQILQPPHQHPSTIFSSQFHPTPSHHKIPQTTLPHPILHTILHHSYNIL
ncbi:ATP-binding protein, partial [Siminovitchia fortis]|uniref:ATP-binding protein n=1 Tax=Siminovitchia fortis TaxID=254758 RepID=UPI0016429A72